MNKKLTLSVDENLITIGKKYAKESGKSMSELFEDFIKETMSQVPKKSKNKKKYVETNGKKIELTGVVAELAGCLKGLDPNVDYKKEYREYRIKKYWDLK